MAAGTAKALSRRSFLVVGAAAGGGLLLGFALPARAPLAQTEAAKTPGLAFAPNAFVRIGSDGRIALVMPQVEMGQGTYTSMPMLLAEELEVPLSAVTLEHAPPDDALYGNPLLGFQVTGGSTSVRGFWEPLRRAGAAARLLLIAAAAREWGVDPAACRAEAGRVFDPTGSRSVGYADLAASAATLPPPADVPLKAPADFRLIGTSAKRPDVPDKARGKALFGIDARPPGVRIATVVACPVAGGSLEAVDDAAALAVRGVHQVVTLDDAVAVVADHMGAAKKGLEALQITWRDGANANLATADLEAALEAAAAGPGVATDVKGDAAGALASAATQVEAVYRMPFLAHTTMEPMNCTVEVTADRCEIWVGTQVASRAQAAAAAITGLPTERVVLHNHLLGGGFGRRLDVDGIEQAVHIARQVQGPVKVIWSREEDIRHDVYRPAYHDHLTAGLDTEGKPLAFRHRVVGSSIIARWLPAFFKDGLDIDAVDGAVGPYGFANQSVDYVRQEPPAGITTGWWRGVGVTHNAFVVESFMDELALAAGQDPLVYRRALLQEAPRARAVLDLAAEKAGWGQPMPARRGRGLSLVFGFGSYVAQVAEVAVAPDGTIRVERVICAVDCGQLVNPDTVRAQMEGGIAYGLSAALYGEITFKDGRVEQGNFDSYPALRIDEMPRVEVHLIESGEAPGGIGEPGTATIAPAVANAVFAATGKRLRRLPLDRQSLAAS